MTSRNRKRGRPVKSPHPSVSVRVLAGHARDHLSEKRRYMISKMKRLFAELGKNPTRGVRHRGLVRVSPQAWRAERMCCWCQSLARTWNCVKGPHRAYPVSDWREAEKGENKNLISLSSRPQPLIGWAQLETRRWRSPGDVVFGVNFPGWTKLRVSLGANQECSLPASTALLVQGSNSQGDVPKVRVYIRLGFEQKGVFEITTMRAS